VTYILYHEALSAYWRFDDGAHLGFAAMYKPWEYFFIPEITRQHSISSVGPWNVLTYDINLRLFGFSPAGFYAHQVMAVWLAGLVTFILLRLWMVYLWALFGAVLFLAGVPTLFIANELMTGHYLEGMLLMIAALYCYVRALRKERFLLALVGAIFYLITVTTKEIYVPLAVFLVFIPEGNFPRRIKYALPFFICAAAYVLWRYSVLGKVVGGYSVSYAAGFDPVLVAKTFAGIPILLLGNGPLGIFACLAIAALFAWGLFTRRISLIPFLSAFSLILMPLVPLAHWPGINIADRYLFLPWWGICCSMAFVLSHLRQTTFQKVLAIILSAIVLFTVVRSNLREREFLRSHASLQTEIYRFILNSNSEQVFLRPRIGDEFGYFPIIINGILKADERFNPRHVTRAAIISDESDLAKVDLKAKTVWSYSEECKCVENITPRVPKILKKFKVRSSLYRGVKIHDTNPKTFAEKKAGHVDAASIRGRRVTIEGWASLPYTEVGQTIHVFLSSPPVSASGEIIERPDVARTLHDDTLIFSGFRITLDFKTASQAKQALSELCIAADSGARPLMLLLSQGSHCEYLSGGKEMHP